MLWITFAWGSCFLAISIGLKDAPLLWFAALRALIAGAVLLAVAVFRREPTPRGARTWALIAVMGIVNVTLAFSAMFGGLAGLSTGAASVLANAQPLLIVLPAWWIYKERVSARTLAAMGTGFAGLLAVALPSGTGTGAWLSITAALAVTAGTLISRQVKADVLQVIAWHFLIGGAILAVIAVLTEGRRSSTGVCASSAFSCTFPSWVPLRPFSAGSQKSGSAAWTRSRHGPSWFRSSASCCPWLCWANARAVGAWSAWAWLSCPWSSLCCREDGPPCKGVKTSVHSRPRTRCMEWQGVQEHAGLPSTSKTPRSRRNQNGQ